MKRANQKDFAFDFAKGFAAKFAAGLVAASIAICGAPGSAWAGGKDRVALVYKGVGACQDQCSKAAADIARSAGLVVRYVTRDSFDEKIFNDAVVWIQPGGNAIKVAKYMGKKRLETLRDWISAGGAYVGFCAGAFLADKYVDDEDSLPGLGLIPWSTSYTGIDSGKDGTLVELNWLGRKRTLYFNGGATFKMKPKDHESATILATYQDGKVAALQTTFGSGKVVISGAHPEALDSWKTDAKLDDPDGRDWDLALDMLERAIY